MFSLSADGSGITIVRGDGKPPPPPPPQSKDGSGGTPAAGEEAGEEAVAAPQLRVHNWVTVWGADKRRPLIRVGATPGDVEGRLLPSQPPLGIVDGVTPIRANERHAQRHV